MQSENTDGEVVDLNGRYVQLGDFKSLVNLSQESSGNNQIDISFQSLNLEMTTSKFLSEV